MTGHQSTPVALVTGAAGGIGRATVQAYLAAGYRVAAVDVADAVHHLPDALDDGRGDRVRTYTADVTDVAAVDELAAAITAAFGRLDSLALVAGIVQRAAPVAELDPDHWRTVLDVNLTGPFLLCRALVPLLQTSGTGTITMVSSWWGRSGHAFFSAYCSAKAALIVFAQSLADELAPTVRVNTVCPGNIDTGMHRAALQSEADERGITFQEMKDLEWAKIPLQIAGPPAAIADAIVWLSSPGAAYVTGASLDVNGGVVFH